MHSIDDIRVSGIYRQRRDSPRIGKIRGTESRVDPAFATIGALIHTVSASVDSSCIEWVNCQRGDKVAGGANP